eukprot:COSAG01_NODE_20227_length_964_cov_3.966474_1_plen_74_part_10
MRCGSAGLEWFGGLVGGALGSCSGGGRVGVRYGGPRAWWIGVSWGSSVTAFRPDILLYRSEDPLGHVKWLPPGE